MPKTHLSGRLVAVIAAGCILALFPNALPAQTTLTITTSALPNAELGMAYTASLQAAGGRAPLHWQYVSGSMPFGIALLNTGALMGTPTRTGNSSFQVRVTDAAGKTDSKTVSLSVVRPLSITTATLPAGIVSVVYSAKLTASNGTPPYAWSTAPGQLPSGLDLSASGSLSGTPAAFGSFALTVEVRDAAGKTASRALTLSISGVSITTKTPPVGTIGVSYRTTLAAVGGTLPYTWSLLSGQLPAGLSLASSGTLSGIPTLAGSFAFTVQVQEAGSGIASKALTVSTAPPVSITTATLPEGTVSTAYSTSLAATGGTPPYTWSVTAGQLPASLAVSAAGVFSGTPAAAGSASFTIEAKDAAGRRALRALSMSVATPLSVMTVNLPDGTVGKAYNATLLASGGTAPYIWSMTAGTLPAGISLGTSGAISGTPTAAASAAFTVQARDAAGRLSSQPLSISVATPLSIMTVNLPDGAVGTAYSATLLASGGTAPYTWGVTAGTLPVGLNLGTSGAISGTPAAAGSSSFTVQAKDAAGRIASQPLTVSVGTALSIITTSLPNGTSGTAYNATIAATGGTAPYTWSMASGQLPAGLILSSVGILSGTPTAAGSFSFTVQAKDAAGRTASQPLSVSICAALSITTTSLPNGTAGTTYSTTLAATGGTAPYTWGVMSGMLPPGVSLFTTSGIVSGTPSAGGSYNAIMCVTDSAGRQASRTFSIIIAAAFAITTASLPDGTVAVAYSATLTTTGGTAPLTWGVSSGQLPAGLALGPTGTVSGTPVLLGPFGFTAQVTDAKSQTASRAYTGAIRPRSSFSVLTNGLHLARIGEPYEAVLTAGSGAAPLNWSISAGQLPPGLTLDSQSGHIAGTPTQGGQFPVTVAVTDSTGASATRGLNLQVFELQLDKYGGLIDVACAQGPQPHFYTEKIQDRWVFCTPAGHVFWSMGVANVKPQQAAIASTKYASGLTANYSLNWSLAAVRRLQAWGFNTIQSGLNYCLPSFPHPVWPTADRTIPVRMPYVVALGGTTGYATYNLNHWAPGPTKNYATNYKKSVSNRYMPGSPDAFDSNYEAFVTGRLANDAKRPAWTGPNTDYLVGFVTDETDNLGGVRSGADFGPVMHGKLGTPSGDSHWGFQTLISSPVVSAIASTDCFRGCPTDILYADPKFYSKWELAAWLQQANEAGPGYRSIAELNAEWGSNYSSFGSDAQTWSDTIGVGDGTTTTFAYTLSHRPLTPLTVRVKLAEILAAGDNAAGPRAATPTSTGVLLTGGAKNSTIGSIDYTTGTVSVTFVTPPAAGAPITITYQTGGWGQGRGLLDEDGLCPSAAGQTCWVPTDFSSLRGAIPRMKSDLDNFLYHWAKKVFKSQCDPVRAAVPNVLVAGPMLGSWGTPPRAQVLKAAGEVMDFFYVATVPPDDPYGVVPDSQARVDFIAKNAGDKPWVLWEGFPANPDSYMASFNNQSGNMFALQSDRGQFFERKVNQLLSTQISASCNCSSPGTFPVLGFWWWDYMDMPSEKMNWGFADPLDNPYDGVSASERPGADSWGYPTGCLEGVGCEQGNYGDFLSWVIRANLNALRQIHPRP